MNELKPCPLCKGAAKSKSIQLHAHLVECVRCEVSTGLYDSVENAAIAWNTRPSLWIPITAATMPEKETERFSKDFLMWPMTTNGYPLGAYDFVGKRWFVARAPDSYKPKFYMPIPPLPEK